MNKEEISKISKAELVEKFLQLQEEYEDLEQQYNDLDDCYAELENSYCEDKKEEEVKINLGDFLWQMKNYGLYNDKMEDFVDNYCKFYI